LLGKSNSVEHFREKHANRVVFFWVQNYAKIPKINIKREYYVPIFSFFEKKKSNFPKEMLEIFLGHIWNLILV